MTNLNAVNTVVTDKAKNTNSTANKPTAAGVVMGLGIVAETNFAKRAISPHITEAMNKIGHNLSNDEFQSIKKATADLVKTAGLDVKGVKIAEINGSNFQDAANSIANGLKKQKTAKFLPEEVVKLLSENYAQVVKKGQNAFFQPSSNKIYIGEGKELAGAVFHETGHAINTNLSKIGKMLQNSRKLSLLALPIVLISLLHKDKTDNEGNTSAINKTGGFIKKHAGALTFATFLPTILEEGMASLRGGKLAKQMLDPSLVKKINKTNALGFASYLVAGILSALGAKAAIAVSDKISEKNAKKAALNQQ